MTNEVIISNINDAILNKPEIGVIVGFYDHHDLNGVQGYAVDARDGETMAAHFCSSPNWAQSDLGFSVQGIPLGGSDVNNEERNRTFLHKYPGGYVTYWIGSAYASDFGMEIRNKQYEFKRKRSLEMIVHEVLHYDGSEGKSIVDALADKYQVEGKAAMAETYEQRMKESIEK